MNPKIIFIYFTLILICSCTNDDLDTDGNLKDSTLLKHSRSIYSENPETLVYGMPFDDQYLNERDLIKLEYFVNDEASKFDIRSKFYRRHPRLVLVKISTERSPIEYWFLKPKGDQNSGSSQPTPEEDPDISTVQERQRIIYKIQNHPLIDMCDHCETPNDGRHINTN